MICKIKIQSFGLKNLNAKYGNKAIGKNTVGFNKIRLNNINNKIPINFIVNLGAVGTGTNFTIWAAPGMASIPFNLH